MEEAPENGKESLDYFAHANGVNEWMKEWKKCTFCAKILFWLCYGQWHSFIVKHW